MTQEEKAKAYDRALEMAKEIINSYEKRGLKELLFYAKEDLEGIFPELAESEGERIKGAIIDHLKDSNLTEWAAWLEKQGEQKPANTAEPKFKVGDWVVIKANGNENVRQIVCIEYFANGQPQYISSNGLWFGNGTEARLWTIQDAKDGDVLADDYGIYIFDRFDEHYERCFLCMGAYQYSQKVFKNEHMLCSVEVYPATKEQRDLLFQKMHEAGYMWDSKSKQLLSLKAEPSGKQKPAGWSEEDEEMCQNIHECLKNGWRKLPTDLLKYESWIKSLKQRR